MNIKNSLICGVVYVIITLFLTSVAIARDCVAVWGDMNKWYGPEFVLRYKIIDSETHMPIRNALITFTEADSRTLSLRTDENGVGIIMVIKQDGFTSADVEITASNYQYWEQKIDYWDLKNSSNDRRLYINGMSSDWTAISRPSMAETVNALKFGNYKILRNEQRDFYAPGCFEFLVEMTTVERDVYYNEKPDHTTSWDRNYQRDSKYRKSQKRGPAQKNNEGSRGKFNEQYYYNTEWKLHLSEQHNIKYIMLKPGKILYKNDPYLEYSPANINWWIEKGQMILDLGNYEKLVFDLETSSRNHLSGINEKDNSKIFMYREEDKRTGK